MKVGNKRLRGQKKGLLMRIESFLILLLMLLSFMVAFADTPDESCANDVLFLESPESILIRQQVHGRRGVVISWEDIDLNDASCYALVGHENLSYPVSVQGGFADQVDRQLLFDASGSGNIGSDQASNLLVGWYSEGTDVNGSLSGIFNLSNNGGVFGLDPAGAAGNWEQLNGGLPMNWRQVNFSALDVGQDGFMLGALTAGQTLGSQFRGLWAFDNGTWSRIAENFFSDSIQITHVVISPVQNSHFAVGTAGDGLYVTRDGGETFQNWGVNFDPDFEAIPANIMISALEWTENQIVAFASRFGLFVSDDDGLSFQRSLLEVPEDLDTQDLSDPAHPVYGDSIFPPVAYKIRSNPNNPDHVLISLGFHGVVQSFDACETWSNTYGDLHVVDPDIPGSWSFNSDDVLVDPNNPDILINALKSQGLYRSEDGGETWVQVGEDVLPDNLSVLREFSLVASSETPGTYYCVQDLVNVIVSVDYGLSWTLLDPQPALNTAVNLVQGPDGRLFIGSWGGGIYEAGSPLNISDTYDNNTTVDLRDLDLGLQLVFDSGLIEDGPQFRLKCQTFQGWGVWRAPAHSPDDLVLIGIYDRVNPESCIEGYCGDTNWQIIPECYNSKRAACFDFDTPDTVRFFDEEVYNGFSYYYAISSFDYGNTALTSPQNNQQTAVYSARWPGDELSPFGGAGNRTLIELNNDPTAPHVGEEIYVYPNPLREGKGIPGSEGETVAFTNLPAESRVRVFTPAGDDVINLGPEMMHEGNIFWGTRNRENERVAAGVYLYKVIMPSREDYWGRLVIIR